LNALNKASDKVMQLLGNNCMILPNNVPLDDEMGECASENYLIQQSLPHLIFYFHFLFLLFEYLRHMMARSYYEMSTVFLFLPPLVARGVHVGLEVWLTPELWGSQKLLVLDPT
jgi:hypothetical protein